MDRPIITQEELELLFPNKIAQEIAVRVLGLRKRLSIDIIDEQPVVIKRNGIVVYKD